MTPTPAAQPRLIVVMGVSGAGKSTIGEALADRLGVPFIDADNLHPRANVEKMRGGTPLVDADRWPWLEIVADAMRNTADTNGRVVCACSALKRAYRDCLTTRAGEPIAYLLLHGEKAVIAARQANRPGHFMPAALLESQFATLEPFAADEHGIVLDVALSIDEIVDQAEKALSYRRSTE
ncbi:gluconokinase [Pelagibacterium sp. 26DY04]|uniref:gluconokinase n=1 Tax=Pelagibacterium sp. 26DY04 TaxID=2967130 RepID=UPI0028158AC2|nr:gluconokinase [Pelagibacterium sp. 26DY04]WMT85651.1 gluconokinase [Pelagibacterium sp. 26DY04]